MNAIFDFFKWKDVFSLLCAIFGFFAITVTFSGNFLLAAVFLGLAGIVDYIDGFMARKFSTPTDYGANIDAVADAVAFGVSPAIFIFFYAFFLNDQQIFSLDTLFYMLISIIVMCAGLMRLARYLCLENEKKKENKEHKNEGKHINVYVGMPITFNALIIPLLYLLSDFLSFNMFFLSLISAYLMISTINFRKI